jgi:hypothetical protein
MFFGKRQASGKKKKIKKFEFFQILKLEEAKLQEEE